VTFTILRRTKAKGALLRGRDGKVRHAFVSEGDLTCKEMERRVVESAYDEGVPQTDRNIVILEAKDE
jgi:hypothetical protein